MGICATEAARSCWRTVQLGLSPTAPDYRSALEPTCTKARALTASPLRKCDRHHAGLSAHGPRHPHGSGAAALRLGHRRTDDTTAVAQGHADAPSAVFALLSRQGVSLQLTCLGNAFGIAWLNAVLNHHARIPAKHSLPYNVLVGEHEPLSWLAFWSAMFPTMCGRTASSSSSPFALHGMYIGTAWLGVFIICMLENTVCPDLLTIRSAVVQSPTLKPAIAAALVAGATSAVTQGNAANAAAVIDQTQASRILGRAPSPAGPSSALGKTPSAAVAPQPPQPPVPAAPPIAPPEAATPAGPAPVPSTPDGYG